MAFLAENADDARQVGNLERVDHVGGAQARLRHAHVERPVLLKREAALRLVDLHRRHADIEHHAVDARPPKCSPIAKTAPGSAPAFPNSASIGAAARMTSGSGRNR
jgi:hypothetical protein